MFTRYNFLYYHISKIRVPVYKIRGKSFLRSPVKMPFAEPLRAKPEKSLENAVSRFQGFYMNA